MVGDSWNNLKQYQWSYRDLIDHYLSNHDNVKKLSNLEKDLLNFFSRKVVSENYPLSELSLDSSFLEEISFFDFALCFEALLLEDSLKQAFSSKYNINAIKSERLRTLIMVEIESL